MSKHFDPDDWYEEEEVEGYPDDDDEYEGGWDDSDLDEDYYEDYPEYYGYEGEEETG